MVDSCLLLIIDDRVSISGFKADFDLWISVDLLIKSSFILLFVFLYLVALLLIETGNFNPDGWIFPLQSTF